jgi:hypothetical protein
MIESKANYILAQAETKSVLYNKELLVIQNKLSSHPPDIDRWLALLVGNTLYNKRETQKFFNWDIENFEHLFDLIRNWNYVFKASAPIWGKPLFKGIRMSGVSQRSQLSNLDLSGIDFSYSELKEIDISGSDITSVKFNEIVIKGAIIAHLTKCDHYIIPTQIANMLALLGTRLRTDTLPLLDKPEFDPNNEHIRIIDIIYYDEIPSQWSAINTSIPPTLYINDIMTKLTGPAIKQGWLKVGDVKRWTK